MPQPFVAEGQVSEHGGRFARVGFDSTMSPRNSSRGGPSKGNFKSGMLLILASYVAQSDTLPVS